eukprot:2907444-Amphidinium_carterae.1
MLGLWQSLEAFKDGMRHCTRQQEFLEEMQNFSAPMIFLVPEANDREKLLRDLTTTSSVAVVSMESLQVQLLAAQAALRNPIGMDELLDRLITPTLPKLKIGNLSLSHT